ncbi:cytochrome C oxidase subunit IV family protein [Caballeronia udeis]|uniref:hypothetical protein n=1 Tax=Caballeronia udeis TaxID=1232866 RepID=UPI000785A12A|nr:hypothetical protein [Caballeronia udeis]
MLSVILTAASFLVVMEHALPASTAIPVIAALALVQVVVHLGGGKRAGHRGMQACAKVRILSAPLVTIPEAPRRLSGTHTSRRG